MKYKQLYDPYSQTIYSIDDRTMIFGACSDELDIKIRLKAHHSNIFTALFTEHPKPVPYKYIKEILKKNGLSCLDDTHLHRRVSELRIQLNKQNINFKRLIENIRGVGYSLPLYFKEPTENSSSRKTLLKNKKLQKKLTQLEEVIHVSFELSKSISIIKVDSVFILNRSQVAYELEKTLKQFIKINNNILKQLKLHEVDFLMLRIELVLSRLKTYIGLARVSEFSITKEQWSEWHKNETDNIFAELVSLLIQSEV